MTEEDCFEARFAVAPRVCLDNVISGSAGAIECAARFLGGICSGNGRPLSESALGRLTLKGVVGQLIVS